ncbi:MAG TPA: hypothetical protein VNT57_07360 [Desulfobacteria bacterium]|nr:hypothetical protein [Desulfobacteria bacterium]
MASVRLILLLLVIFAVISGITVFLHYMFRKKILIKYIPGLLFLLVGVYFFYLSRQVSDGFRDIAMLIMAFMAMAGFAGGIITSVFIDAILPIIRSTKEM